MTTPAGPWSPVEYPTKTICATGGDEPVEEILREAMIDLDGRTRRAERPVEPREVDVDVEPVLVGHVLVSHRAAALAADVADDDARRPRVRGAVRLGSP